MGIAILAIYCLYWVVALRQKFICLLTFDRLTCHDACQKRVMEVSTQPYKVAHRPLPTWFSPTRTPQRSKDDPDASTTPSFCSNVARKCFVNIRRHFGTLQSAIARPRREPNLSMPIV